MGLDSIMLPLLLIVYNEDIEGQFVLGDKTLDGDSNNVFLAPPNYI